MKKNLVIKFGVRSSEYEITQTNLYSVTSSNVFQFAEDEASKFFGESDGEDDGEHSFNGGEIVAYVLDVKEVSEDEMDVLKKYIQHDVYFGNVKIN